MIPVSAGRALGRLGDAADAVASEIRTAPRSVRAALAVRRHRRMGIAGGVAVLAVYLLSIGDLAISTTARWAAAPPVQIAPDNLFRLRAPYLFEPILAVRPDAHVSVFLSPINLLLGGIVAALAACNLAIAGLSTQRASCRRTAYGRLIGALPAFLLGFACCVPTVLLALSAGAAAALLPVLLPLRPVFYPLAIALLVASLLVGTRRLGRTAADSAENR